MAAFAPGRPFLPRGDSDGGDPEQGRDGAGRPRGSAGMGSEGSRVRGCRGDFGARGLRPSLVEREPPQPPRPRVAAVAQGHQRSDGRKLVPFWGEKPRNDVAGPVPAELGARGAAGGSRRAPAMASQPRSAQRRIPRGPAAPGAPRARPERSPRARAVLRTPARGVRPGLPGGPRRNAKNVLIVPCQRPRFLRD